MPQRSAGVQFHQVPLAIDGRQGPLADLHLTESKVNLQVQIDEQLHLLPKDHESSIHSVGDLFGIRIHPEM